MAKFDTESYIGIGLAVDELVQRLGGTVLCFHLHWNQGITAADEEIHLYRRLLVAIEVKAIPLFHQHLANRILVDSTLVSVKVPILAKVSLRLLVE